MARTPSDPLRIVVLGSSVGYYLRPARASLDERTYAEHVQALLRAHEVPAEVRNASSWTMVLPEAVQRLEELVLLEAPDVVIVNLGIVDCEPRTIPLRTLRWLFTKSPSGGALSLGVRRVVAPWVYRFYTEGSPRLLRAIRMPPRVPVGRFRRELRTLVELIRRERGALVLVVGITPPGDRLEEVLPGTRSNAAAFNEILRSVADGGSVQFVDPAHAGIAADALAPDGIHLSADGHRALAELLATEIIAWWRDQQGTLR